MRNSGAKKGFIGLVLQTFDLGITNLVIQIFDGKSVDKIVVNKMHAYVKDLILKLTGGARSSNHFHNCDDLHKKLVAVRDLAQAKSLTLLQASA